MFRVIWNLQTLFCSISNNDDIIFRSNVCYLDCFSSSLTGVFATCTQSNSTWWRDSWSGIFPMKHSNGFGSLQFEGRFLAVTLSNYLYVQCLSIFIRYASLWLLHYIVNMMLFNCPDKLSIKQCFLWANLILVTDSIFLSGHVHASEWTHQLYSCLI